MFVCVCKGVTETQLVEFIEAGRESELDIAQACDAGRDCGSCIFRIKQIIKNHKEKKAPDSKAG